MRPPSANADLETAAGAIAETAEENPADSIAFIMKRVVLSLSYHADKRLGAHDLTIAQWTLLMKLRHGRSCTVVDLARGCQLDAGGTTRLIDRLERKNLCKRTRARRPTGATCKWR